MELKFYQNSPHDYKWGFSVAKHHFTRGTSVKNKVESRRVKSEKYALGVTLRHLGYMREGAAQLCIS